MPIDKDLIERTAEKLQNGLRSAKNGAGYHACIKEALTALDIQLTLNPGVPSALPAIDHSLRTCGTLVAELLKPSNESADGFSLYRTFRHQFNEIKLYEKTASSMFVADGKRLAVYRRAITELNSPTLTALSVRDNLGSVVVNAAIHSLGLGGASPITRFNSIGEYETEYRNHAFVSGSMIEEIRTLSKSMMLGIDSPNFRRPFRSQNSLEARKRWIRKNLFGP